MKKLALLMAAIAIMPVLAMTVDVDGKSIKVGNCDTSFDRAFFILGRQNLLKLSIPVDGMKGLLPGKMVLLKRIELGYTDDLDSYTHADTISLNIDAKTAFRSGRVAKDRVKLMTDVQGEKIPRLVYSFEGQGVYLNVGGNYPMFFHDKTGNRMESVRYAVGALKGRSVFEGLKVVAFGKAYEPIYTLHLELVDELTLPGRGEGRDERLKRLALAKDSSANDMVWHDRRWDEANGKVVDTCYTLDQKLEWLFVLGECDNNPSADEFTGKPLDFGEIDEKQIRGVIGKIRSRVGILTKSSDMDDANRQMKQLDALVQDYEQTAKVGRAESSKMYLKLLVLARNHTKPKAAYSVITGRINTLKGQVKQGEMVVTKEELGSFDWAWDRMGKAGNLEVPVPRMLWDRTGHVPRSDPQFPSNVESALKRKELQVYKAELKLLRIAKELRDCRDGAVAAGILKRLDKAFEEWETQRLAKIGKFVFLRIEEDRIRTEDRLGRKLLLESVLKETKAAAVKEAVRQKLGEFK